MHTASTPDDAAARRALALAMWRLYRAGQRYVATFAGRSGMSVNQAARDLCDAVRAVDKVRGRG